MSRTLTAVIILLAASTLVFAQTTDFAGRYASDGVFVELRPASRGYEGVMREGDQSFPLQGQVRDGRLIGSFTYEGRPVSFDAALEAGKLRLTVGASTLVLARQIAPKTPAIPGPGAVAPAAGKVQQPPATGVTRFRRISVEDRQVIGGEAVSFLVPTVWKVEGGIVWRPHPALPASAQLRAFDPSTLQQVEAFPSFPFTWGDNCGPGKIMPVGSSWFGNEVHPPFNSAQQCLETTIIPRIRGSVRWRVTQREKLPQLAAAQQQNSPGDPNTRVFFDAARIRIEYELNGAPVEEDIFGVMQTAMVPAGNIVIQVTERIVAMRANRGHLEAARPVQLAIVNSSKINPEWFNKYAQLVDFFVRAKIREIHAVGEFSRALSQTSNQISQERMKQWEETNRRQDRIDREWSEYIRGTETYNDPVRGEPVELPSGHNHAWVSRGGEYILTSNPNFNPNVEMRGDWVEMKPTP
jgi:hypothetical protein